jgi:leucyl-tRNA synthetase
MAKKYNIPLQVSIKPKNEALFEKIKNLEECYEGEGISFNSEQFNGLTSIEARPKIIDWLSQKKLAKRKTTFKLRDWVFSRQRYWGEPIPVIHCEKCGIVPVPERDLPVELPKVKNYQPTDSGESPLANISKWVNVKCPKCKGQAKRETDTMPNWAGSSWYYLRYTDPENKKEFASEKNLKYWTPVDWYNGGNEHTTLHLLYSRFWHKFLFDLKLVPTSEPYKKRTSHGMILGEGGVKMSKSLGNVINPDDIVKTYGADTLRIYEMFMGPFSQSVAWSTESIIGSRRFIEKVWRINERVSKQKDFSGLTLSGVPDGIHTVQNLSVSKLLNKTIKKICQDIEEMHFNTAISSMMILATEMEKAENIDLEDYKKFLQILAPFAPHITEEIWFNLGNKNSIHLSDWPKVDESLLKDEEIKIVVQINGKVRTEIMIEVDDDEEKIKKQALSNEIILKHIAEKTIKKVIYVKNRLINIVV